ncbi:MAG: hypothetical protein KJO07_10585 [Deltaproteobacteria bacterium]|nr:hypothetical protein [Deltaproteobacteria bacterium]
MLEPSVQAKSGAVRRYLESAPVIAFSVYAIAAAFLTYFSMYAFRKPFAAGTYKGLEAFGMSLKDILIISQVMGYALSKWLGVKFVTELPAHRRALGLIILIAVAEVALVLFAVVPNQLKVVAIFINGLPLGAVWGLVFGFLEGRRTSEILGAGLSCSYIIASAAVKSVGIWVHEDLGIQEMWMPAFTGLMFLPLFLVTVWMLKQLPPPSAEDIEARVEREPMDREQRHAFVRQFFLGLLALTALYFFLTAFRDYRDNYAAEIFAELGYGKKPGAITKAELPIPFIVMFALGMLYLIKSNRLGLLFAHFMMLFGVVLIGVSTLLLDAEMISPIVWYIGVGLGLYLAYVPYGCVLFDRMIAAVGVVATAVFMIYVTDAAGYVGSIGVVLYKHFANADLSALGFLRKFAYFTSVFCSACFVMSAVYFWHRSRPPKEERS